MLNWAFALTRVWTALYTSGMPPGLRDVRRAEIESDLWEFEHDASRGESSRPDASRAAVHVLLRLIRGLPDDLFWRIELMDLRSRRRRTAGWVVATATCILAAGLWLRASLAMPALPEPPALAHFVAVPRTPPPPPAPPPPPVPSVPGNAAGVTTPAAARTAAPTLPPPPPPRMPRLP